MVSIVGDKRAILILVLVLCFAVVSLPQIGVVNGEPKTIVVPDDYPTIGWAIGNASEGDTVFVKSGIYNETIQINKSLALVGEDKKTTIIDGGKDRTVIQINQDFVNITGLTIQNGESTLSYVPMGGSGIRLQNASYCKIYGNNIEANDYGIKLYSSHSNCLVLNNITDNWFAGVYLALSSCNNISENIITLNVYSGVEIRESCQSNVVIGNIITNNNDGVILWCHSGDYSLNSTKVIGNQISSNTVSGVLLANTNNTDTYGNNITDNGYGVWLYGRYENAKFHHNNFIDNNVQVDTFPYYSTIWDNGYPSGGNFWSNYNGIDNDGDGLGDTPYIIDESNQDNFPLMGQWYPSTEKTEPFPVTWILVIIGIITVVGVAILLYFKKFKKIK